MQKLCSFWAIRKQAKRQQKMLCFSHSSYSGTDRWGLGNERFFFFASQILSLEQRQVRYSLILTHWAGDGSVLKVTANLTHSCRPQAGQLVMVSDCSISIAVSRDATTSPCPKTYPSHYSGRCPALCLMFLWGNRYRKPRDDKWINRHVVEGNSILVLSSACRNSYHNISPLRV